MAVKPETNYYFYLASGLCKASERGGGGKIPGARSAQRGPETGPEIYLVSRTAIQSAGMIFSRQE